MSVQELYGKGFFICPVNLHVTALCINTCQAIKQCCHWSVPTLTICCCRTSHAFINANIYELVADAKLFHIG